MVKGSAAGMPGVMSPGGQHLGHAAQARRERVRRVVVFVERERLQLPDEHTPARGVPEADLTPGERRADVIPNPEFLRVSVHPEYVRDEVTRSHTCRIQGGF